MKTMKKYLRIGIELGRLVFEVGWFPADTVGLLRIEILCDEDFDFTFVHVQVLKFHVTLWMKK